MHTRNPMAAWGITQRSNRYEIGLKYIQKMYMLVLGEEIVY